MCKWMVFFILFFPLFSLAGNRNPGDLKDVSGEVVSSSDKSPVAGATIIIKGTKTGTSTGLDGKFSIKAKEGDVLVISGVGITQKEVVVGH